MQSDDKETQAAGVLFYQYTLLVMGSIISIIARYTFAKMLRIFSFRPKANLATLWSGIELPIIKIVIKITSSRKK